MALAGCGSAEPIIRTETVEVNVPVYVPLPVELTTPVAEPAPPARDGFDGEALVDWVERLRAALREANAKLAGVRSKQPGEAP